MIGRVCTAVLLAVAIAVGQAVAGPATEAQQSQREELERLRQEIARVRAKIREKEKREQAILDVLSGLDREIDLTHKLVVGLRRQARRKQRQIAASKSQIATLEKQLTRLKDAYRKRVVRYYVKGKVPDLALLLRGWSLHRTLVWLKFERLLAERDQRTLREIKEKQRRLEARKQVLELQLSEQRRLLREKQQEERALRKKREQRQRLLRKVREDRQLYERRLREYEEAEREIRRLIGKSVERRKEGVSPRPFPHAQNLSKWRGRLPWPVKGRVIAHFGRTVHPKFKTVTQNLGIDIRAPRGTPVQAVADGRVTAITWLRGRGNLVIISHAGGYYTVYTHLEEIRVGLDEDVRAGQVIGTVGESGSLDGPKLHFEIWHNTKNLNPERWLKR
ncbi:MAG: peptidoglycan DD-metalloendopeptidase family protein [Calditrichaeota bacterium]|nr:peptidoglycan DD-metalloendopeptidase family protein [Calditrichota bacterium]